MPDQIDEQPVVLSAAAAVQVGSFTLPEGMYAAISRRTGSLSPGQTKWSAPRFLLIVTAAALAQYGEPVRPDAIGQEIDVTDLVRLGLLTVE